MKFTMAADLVGRYEREDMRRIEREGMEDHGGQEHVMGTGLEHDDCAAVLSRLSRNTVF